MILEMLEAAGPEELKSKIIGIISPHTGYIYSGKIAAEAYSQIRHSEFYNVVVTAPSHREYYDGCSIFYGNYETPLRQ